MKRMVKNVVLSNKFSDGMYTLPENNLKLNDDWFWGKNKPLPIREPNMIEFENDSDN